MTMNGTDFVISDDFGAYPLPDGLKRQRLIITEQKLRRLKVMLEKLL